LRATDVLRVFVLLGRLGLKRRGMLDDGRLPRYLRVGGCAVATERQVLERLRGLEPDKWAEVLDFIDYLRQRPTARRAQAHTKQLTARDLLQSSIVGL